jgi:hypothetical protein
MATGCVPIYLLYQMSGEFNMRLRVVFVRCSNCIDRELPINGSRQFFLSSTLEVQPPELSF